MPRPIYRCIALEKPDRPVLVGFHQLRSRGPATGLKNSMRKNEKMMIKFDFDRLFPRNEGKDNLTVMFYT